ncbi:DUF3817 domain-containing protein [Metabacillus sp. GX 13764]|uniref:DUF3817 domain-containing protein n=1 Tax=Metabacillus kandeliae TaxID=2900151 RepID=UPI001E418A32|nr:DUF3817 domain-containing protein [Metabacillus kandeliae]MCD7035785.1 DUF3817 domain-containing protein [Metabacillus kandeliae]
MLNSPIERLKLIGTIEGISFIVLLAIAMPLKYAAGFPLAVTIVGGLHGLFFVLFLLAVANAAIAHKWSLLAAFGAVIASIIPFGTFVLNSKLNKRQTV